MLVVFLTMLGTQSSCGGGGSPSEDMPERIRVVNGLIEEDSIQVSFGSENPVQTEVPFGEDSGYLDVPEGDEVPVRVRKESTVVPSVNGTLSVESGKTYTYYVLEAEDAVVGNLVEDEDKLVDNTAVSVRVFNAAVSDEGVDFYVTFRNEGISGESPVISAAAFNSPSSAVIFDAGTYRLSVTREGGESPIAVLPAVELVGGTTYTIVVLESQDGGSPYSLLVLSHRS